MMDVIKVFTILNAKTNGRWCRDYHLQSLVVYSWTQVSSSSFYAALLLFSSNLVRRSFISLIINERFIRIKLFNMVSRFKGLLYSSQKVVAVSVTFINLKYLTTIVNFLFTCFYSVSNTKFKDLKQIRSFIVHQRRSLYARNTELLIYPVQT